MKHWLGAKATSAQATSAQPIKATAKKGREYLMIPAENRRGGGLSDVVMEYFQISTGLNKISRKPES